MLIQVRRVVISISDSNLDLQTINQILLVALEYSLFDVTVDMDQDGTHFSLVFKQERSSVFVNEWVKFWMRPFDLEYKIRFEKMEDGDKIAA